MGTLKIRCNSIKLKQAQYNALVKKAIRLDRKAYALNSLLPTLPDIGRQWTNDAAVSLQRERVAMIQKEYALILARRDKHLAAARRAIQKADAITGNIERDYSRYGVLGRLRGFCQ